MNAQVVEKIVKDNEIEGYKVLLNGNPMTVPKDALYTEMLLVAMTESGYKYYSREANDITDKDDNKISDLPEMKYEDVDQVSWKAAVDMAERDAMSDFQASKYYSSSTNSVVFKQPVNVEINTREELIAYLRGLKVGFGDTLFCNDNRPLNSYVNPDALFTIDEINDNAEYLDLFNVIQKKHIFRDYNAYEELLQWLYDNGALTHTDKVTPAEFLAAYYAWGPEGLKDSCTSSKTRLAVDGMFLYSRDPLKQGDPAQYATSNRENVPCLYHNKNLYYYKYKVDFSQYSEIADFKRERLCPSAGGMITSLHREQATEKGKYKLSPNAKLESVRLSDVSDRLYFELISKSNYNYQYKVSIDKLRLGLAQSNTASNVLLYNTNFAIQTIMPGIHIPLNMVSSRREYNTWNKAIVITNRMTLKNTKDPLYNNTMEYLRNEGMNPIAAAQYMCANGDPELFKLNGRYAVTDGSITDAISDYCGEIPSDVLTAFKIDDTDIDMKTFVETADIEDLLERRAGMDSGIVSSDSEDFDPTYASASIYGKQAASTMRAQSIYGKAAHDAVSFYNKCRYIYDCYCGFVSTGKLYEGKMADMASTSTFSLATLLFTVGYAEFGENYDAIDNYLDNIETTELVNVKRLFPMRDNAYNGYIMDVSDLRYMRASLDKVCEWVYISKIFTEISNLPIEQRRPYMLEIFILNKYVKEDFAVMSSVRNLVYQSLASLSGPMYEREIYYDYDTNTGTSVKDCMLKSSDQIAATILFDIIRSSSKHRGNNDSVTLTLPVFGDISVDITVPNNIKQAICNINIADHKRYITLYDLCVFEYNQFANSGQFYVVNATFDPWHVYPRNGQAIRSYQLMPNYYNAAALDGANGEGWYSTHVQDKSICTIEKSLVDVPSAAYEPKIDYEDWKMAKDNSNRAVDPESLYGTLAYDANEYIFDYVKRWALERKKAKAKGLKLVSVPLKQDITFSNIAPMCGLEVAPLEPVTIDDSMFDNCACQNRAVMIPWKASDDVALLMSSIKGTVVRDITRDDLYTAESLPEYGSYKPSMNYSICGVFMITELGDFVRDEYGTPVKLHTLNKKQLDEFASKNWCYKLCDGLYYFKAANGDKIVEVCND